MNADERRLKENFSIVLSDDRGADGAAQDDFICVHPRLSAVNFLTASSDAWRAWRLHHLQDMTRSIFDPTGDETEHSGNRFTPPDAAEISQMPPDVTDGKVEEDEEEEQAERNAQGEPPEKP